MNKILILIGIFCLNISYGQLKQTARLEYGNLNQENTDIINLGSNGLIHVTRIEVQFPNVKLEVKKLDTNLQLKWTKYFTINREYYIFGQEVQDGLLYLILTKDDVFSTSLVVEIEPKQGGVKTTSFRNSIRLTVTEFLILNNGENIVLAGYYNNRPLAIFYKLENERPLVLPGFNNDFRTLAYIEQTTKNKSFSIALTDVTGRDYGIWINTYNYDGTFQKSNFIGTENQNYPKDVIWSGDFGESICVGTYGPRTTNYSNGFFIYKNNKINYFSFGDLNRFYDIYNLKRKRRLYRRVERKNEDGRKFRMGYKIVFRDLLFRDNKFFLIADAYYAGNSKIVRSNFNITLSRQNNTVENSNIFTHTLVFCFDENINLIWNNLLETKEKKTYDLEPIAGYQYFNENIILAYNYKDRLIAKVANEFSSLQTNTFLELKFDKDEFIFTSDYQLKVDGWYENKLIIYGVQHLKNNTEYSVPLNRWVQSLSKLEYSIDINGN